MTILFNFYRYKIQNTHGKIKAMSQYTVLHGVDGRGPGADNADGRFKSRNLIR